MLADSCLAEACVTFHVKIHAIFRIPTPYMYVHVKFIYIGEKVDDGEGCRGWREGVESVNRGRLRMCPIGCWSVMHGAQNGSLSCSA